MLHDYEVCLVSALPATGIAWKIYLFVLMLFTPILANLPSIIPRNQYKNYEHE
jgi:hypothetical protein